LDFFGGSDSNSDGFVGFEEGFGFNAFGDLDSEGLFQGFDLGGLGLGLVVVIGGILRCRFHVVGGLHCTVEGGDAVLRKVIRSYYRYVCS